MKFLSLLIGLLSLVLAPIYTTIGQTKQTGVVTVQISGNCGMCQKRIEAAANQKNVSELHWDKETGLASLSYNPEKTSQEEVLKKVALAGHDNQEFRAPEEVYEQLPACCQYERPIASTGQIKTDQQPAGEQSIIQQEDRFPFLALFNAYFALKDALVSSDEKRASLQVKDLQDAFKQLNQQSWNLEQKGLWEKLETKLSEAIVHMAQQKSLTEQRKSFSALSNCFYQLAKVTPHPQRIYYQYCPMFNQGEGAYWLAKKEAIANPYYGSQMLSCGRTIESWQ